MRVSQLVLVRRVAIEIPVVQEKQAPFGANYYIFETFFV